MNLFFEMGLANQAFGIPDSDGVGFGLSDEKNFFFPAGDSCVNQVPLEHHKVLLHDRQKHYGVLTSLAFVDGNGIGQGHVGAFGFLKMLYFFIKLGFKLPGFGIYSLNVADVSVEEVFVVVVSELDDFVARMEDLVGLPGISGFGVEGGLQNGIQVVDAGNAFVHGSQDLYFRGRVVTSGGQGFGAEFDNLVDAVLRIIDL